ncbi:thiamine repressible gene regulatory protein thi1 [Colletotrichum truncatum]|uniref:Thiamine repressible gene regulatory protein thi1 n=1 Tax=Colletotrichum truncatum TaxID=5467 RepID=A0ACC3ZIF9_COLTU|nr:thiamine repressible genes regulatory protein thi1 [Colletotrichum truncatum]KAF6785701.1 thiamine repressible genes regulatory protein thi1 [Colletotrichum truncatum]
MAPVLSSRRIRRRRVADEDRKRASRACTRCKARKSKCIETASGICQRCQRGSYKCSFEQQESPTPQTMSQTPVREVSSPHNSTPTPNSGPVADGPEGRPMHRDLCSNGDAPENFMWPRFLSRLRSAFYLESQPTSAEREMARAEAHVPRMSPPYQSAEALRLQAAIDRLPPIPVAMFLARLCIKHGTDSFFYFDQTTFLSELEDFYNNLTSPLRRDASFVCLLLSVLALGSQWTPRARPRTLNPPSFSFGGDPGRVFSDHARILMADTMDRVSMYSVEAAFVLGVYLMPSSAIGASYLYMGLALRKALTLGLHQESEDPDVDNHEKEMRRRLWWAIYSLERTLTIKLNRPRSVGQEIITARLPTHASSDSLQPFNNIDHQIANASFVKIIDTIIEPATWSSVVHPPLGDYEPVLKSWKRSLPAALDLQNLNPTSPHYRAVFHLYLNYYFAWIAVGKTSVVATIRSHLRCAIPDNALLSTLDETTTRQFRSCSRAAKKILNLLECASNTGNIAPSSFTDFQGCSIATIIVVLTGILERDSAYEAQVDFGLSCLRKMANVHTAGRMAVCFVEALLSIAKEARAKLEASKEMQLQTELGIVDSDYLGWADWFAGAVGSSGGEETRPSEPRISPPANSGTTGPRPDVLPVWEEAAALLRLRNPPTPSHTRQPDDVALSPSFMSHEEPRFDAGIDVDIPGFSFTENHMQLMGLTGMDMLDFDFDFQQ